MMTNHKPKAESDDYALWQRLLLIPFTQSFVTRPTAANEHKADRYLPEKLHCEAAGILAWLVRGCLEWQKTGLNPPQSVRLATDEYKKEEDQFEQFDAECIAEEQKQIIRARAAFDAYKTWCDDYSEKPQLGGRKFGEKMAKKYEKGRDKNGNHYKNIKLTISTISFQ